MPDTRTFRIVDEDGDYYEVNGDPMETLTAAYRKRAHLVALLAAVYPAEFREDPDDEDHAWSIIYIDLPTGQASWHIHPNDHDLFPHVKFGTEAEWDGHTTDEKYARIRHLTAQTHAAAKHGETNAAALEGMRAAARHFTAIANPPAPRQEFGVQAEHSTSAFPVRTEAIAREVAAQYSRIREPGCRPVTHYPVTRFAGDWQRLPDATAEEQR